MNDVSIKYGNRMHYKEVYFINGKLHRKGVIVNKNEYGYQECYLSDGILMGGYTGYFLDGKKVSENNEKGYCYIWLKEIV